MTDFFYYLIMAWLIGGIISIISMIVVQIIIRRRRHAFRPYKPKEYSVGFAFSWLTFVSILHILYNNVKPNY